MSKYIIIKDKVYTDNGKRLSTIDGDDIELIDPHVINDNCSGSIFDYVKKEVANKNLEDGDVIYELKPIYKIETQIVATKVRTL